jgi:Protein of unknown function (DUF3574)
MTQVARRAVGMLALTIMMLSLVPAEAGRLVLKAPASAEARAGKPQPERAAPIQAFDSGSADDTRPEPLPDGRDKTAGAPGTGAAQPFVRTELFFGTMRPNGIVTAEEFRQFVDAEVTPRFPDGLTLLKGDGRFRLKDHSIIREESFVLVLLYPHESRDTHSEGIQCIRDRYKELFEQESVLRVDAPVLAWVSF